MSEIPRANEPTLSDAEQEIALDRTEMVTDSSEHAPTPSNRSVGRHAVRYVVPPIVEWGPRQSQQARNQESLTPDELTFGA